MRTRSLRWGSRLLTGVVVAGALACLQAPSAWAQANNAPPPAGGAAKPATPGKGDLAAAKKHYAEGEKKYKAGDFAGAETEFKAANDIKSAPPTERYIGLCEDNLGHLQTAVDWYDKFLSHVPDKMADKGDEIRKREGEIKALPGKVHIDSTPPGASITIDDKPQSAPTPTDVDLAPGQHTIKLTETGRLPSTKQVDVAYASTQTVSVSLDPEPPAAPPPPPVAATPPETPPPPPPPPPAEPRSKVPAYVTGGLAIVAAGVGTVFGIMTLSDKSDFDKNPTTSTADNGDTHALITDMAFGVALTFGVTSAVLFLTKDEPPATSSAAPKAVTAKAQSDGSGPRRAGNHVTVTPTPMVGAHSGGAGLTVRF